MRVVREKMEAKISELPYNLPSDLYDYLAQDVVQQCNHITGKLIIGKLSECVGIVPINSDKFIGSDKIIGWWFSV